MMRLRLSLAKRFVAVAAALIAALASHPVLAGEFALAVTPPRFELQVKPGERTRQILEITNASPDANTLSVKTAD